MARKKAEPIELNINEKVFLLLIQIVMKYIDKKTGNRQYVSVYGTK
ncbi:hypothetical protein LLCC_1083 [Lactococcus cremoris]|uniref:Uncharacterized protein n=1 Tax=Lactococcus lactis subsp. cremoris TaxID=1359 RepID=A0AAD1NJ72_LACLC|nr:hypothetical protein LLCC_1083 [Lactococcus cremoris]BCO04129.1 hypothetical protein LLG32_22230 [Lactococcus cremoris]BCO06984.1 hypothetical protein LLC_22240 [Lactococcus cremoris]